MFTETFSTHPVLYSETKIRISAEYCTGMENFSIFA